MNSDEYIDDSNLFDKLNEISNNISGKLNILDEQIDINIQMEYFDYSKKTSEKFDNKNVIDDKNKLFDKETSIEEKKKLLIQLASIDDVKVYRILEKYSKNPDKELREWSILSLLESRMLLEGSLLNENQIFVSTGLGGKNSKLRYFIVLFPTNDTDFTDGQKKIITKEFEFTLKQHDAEIEKIKFSEHFSTILSLIPLKIAIRDVFKKAISNCNEFGNFIKRDFLITNTKILNNDEINNFNKDKNNKNFLA